MTTGGAPCEGGVAVFWIVLLMAQAAAPTQIDRGEALFFEAPGGCGSCHAMKGKGTPAGSDLKGIARLSPSGIATAIRSTVTQYVQIAKLKTGESFPTMPPTGNDPKVKLYDLSKTPPELHEVDKADIASMTPNNNWKHPPLIRKYPPEQMADIVAYIRFAGANIRQPVDPADVQ
jgi:mono/diheme cytochrome c family protein